MLVYAILGWGFIHLIPFVPALQNFFAMQGQNMDVVWNAILLTDIVVVILALCERCIIARVANSSTSEQAVITE